MIPSSWYLPATRLVEGGAFNVEDDMGRGFRRDGRPAGTTYTKPENRDVRTWRRRLTFLFLQPS
jgi:hypothetical protein